jgi:hypothetical protein
MLTRNQSPTSYEKKGVGEFRVLTQTERSANVVNLAVIPKSQFPTESPQGPLAHSPLQVVVVD